MGAGAPFISEVCGGDEKLAVARVEAIKNKLPLILGNHSGRRPTGESVAAATAEAEAMPWLTWNSLLQASSWFEEHRAYLQSVREMNLAEIFLCNYGIADAPFIAAVNLAQYHTHKVDIPERDASLSFMRVYSEMMNDWYEADQKAAEPIIENVPSQCRCLPRHTKKCPHC